MECTLCRKHFSRSDSLKKHMETIHHQNSESMKALKETKFTCSTCNTQFTEKQNLKRHLKNKHNIDLVEIEKERQSHEQQQQQQQHFKEDERRRQKEESVVEKEKSYKKDKKAVKIVPFDLTLHENNNRFHCSICNRLFVTSESRNRHFGEHIKQKNSFSVKNVRNDYYQQETNANTNNIFRKQLHPLHLQHLHRLIQNLHNKNRLPQYLPQYRPLSMMIWQ